MSPSTIPPEDLELARALVKRVLIAMTGLDRSEAEVLVLQLEMQAAIMKGMRGRS